MNRMSKINPLKVTDFDRTQHALDYFWAYAVICAGKKSEVASKKTVELFETKPPHVRPLVWLSDGRRLLRLLEANKVGQYNRLSRCFKESVNVDLRTATVDELDDVHGIGGKTARFFVVHSRRDAECSPLDTWILKWIKLHGVRKVPKDTPTSKNQYERLERSSIRLMRKFFPDLAMAEADLLVWKVMSGREESENREAFPV